MATKLDREIKRFIKAHLEEWISDTVIQEMIAYSNAADMPRSFVQGIEIEKSRTGYRVVNNWGNKRKPLGLWFEAGTVDHYIRPVNANVLTWIGSGPGRTTQERHGPGIFVGGEGDIAGKRFFSRGHYVSGLPALHPMKRGYEKGMQALHRRIQHEVQSQFSRGGRKIEVTV